MIGFLKFAIWYRWFFTWYMVGGSMILLYRFLNWLPITHTNKVTWLVSMLILIVSWIQDYHGTLESIERMKENEKS